jgi:hypothetical protein
MSKDASYVARRLLCLELLFQRLALEEADDEKEAREKARSAWASRIDDLGIGGDLLADERAFLERPVGSLSEDDLDDLEGRVSGALVLLWALGRVEARPTFAMVTDLEEHLEARGLLGDGSIKHAKAAAETATLRSAEELDAALGTYLKARGKAKEIVDAEKIVAAVGAHHLTWILEDEMGFDEDITID